jgi:hypothetical protein
MDMQDSELFELLNFIPRTYRWEVALEPRRPNSKCSDAPNTHWCQWAKELLLQPIHNFNYVELVLRILVVAEVLYGDGMEQNRLEESVGYLIQKLEPRSTPNPKETILLAVQQRWVRQDQIDMWGPGMRSGSGWRTFYRLTLLGKSKVDISDMPPKDTEPTSPYVPRAQRTPTPTPPTAPKPSPQSPTAWPWPKTIQPSAPAQAPVQPSAEPTPLPNDFVWVKHYVDQQVSRFFKHHANAYAERVKQVLDGTCDLKTFGDEFGPARICRWINDKHAVGDDHPNPCKSQNINTSATYEACVKSFKQNPSSHPAAKYLYASESAEMDAILKDLLGTGDCSE